MKSNDNSCTANTEAQDIHVIDSFLVANGQDMAVIYQDGAGYYSGILDAGTGSTSPTNKNDKIVFDQVWRLLNGTVLDSSRSASTLYGELYGNPDSKIIYDAFGNMKEDDIFRIVVLSRYQFACVETPLSNGKVVPANSQIIVDYRLVSVVPDPAIPAP
jgi:hypothetical protein